MTLPAPKVSLGNAKLKETFLWSIPPVSTCPGATPLCKKYCYALKAYRLYPTVKKANDYNYELSQRDDFVEIMVQYFEGERNSRRKTSKYEYVRVHESGDFYNQAYVNKFAEIARRLPHLQFLAYTKSAWLDFSGMPANFVIRLSIWEDSNPKLLKNMLDYPRAIMEGLDERPDTFYCGDKLQCHTDCDRYCWTKTTDVKFTQH